MKTIVVFFVSFLAALHSNAQPYTNGYKTDSFPLTGVYLEQWKRDSVNFDKLINTDSIEYYLLIKFNDLRKLENLKPLRMYVNDSAYVNCNEWAEYLLKTKKLGHRGEDYEIACMLIVKFNRYRDINKYIADELYNKWVNSPNHKLAILNPDKKYMISCNATKYYYGFPFFSKKLIGLVRFFE
jgi:uncharacterized protein YkwD